MPHQSSKRLTLLAVWLSALCVVATACGPDLATPTIVPTATVPPSTGEATATSQSTTEPVPTDTAEPPPSPTTANTPAPTINPADYQWTQVGLKDTGVSSLALLPQGTNIVLAAGPTGVWRSSYDYTNWSQLDLSLDAEGRLAQAAIGSPEVMYVTHHTGCPSGMPISSYRSTDGGQTWQTMSANLTAIAASNATIAYGTGCSSIFKTTDSGQAWTELSGSAVVNFDPHSIAASPDGEQVYAAYVSEGGSGRIMMSTDGGVTWQEITPKNSPNSELRAPANLTFVPGSVGRPDDGGVYMTSDEGVWFLPLETTDWKLAPKEGGQEPPPGSDYLITALFVDTAYSEEYNKPGPIIYAARVGQGEFGLGVFRSTDGGATWQSIGKGLDQRRVNSIVLAPHDPVADPTMVETLLAATDDGIWAIPMPPPFR